MHRRFRREVRKTLADHVPPILQEANFVFDKGEYGRAAELFEQIAQTTDARGAPRAALFQLQAGRARVLAGQVALGMPSLRRSLELLIERQQFARLHKWSQRVIAELREHSFDSEATELETWVQETALGQIASPEPAPILKSKPTLPTHCPACGAILRPDEVEWLDNQTAECAYCGSPVRA